MNFRTNIIDTGSFRSFSLNWNEINFYENQLKSIRSEVGYDSPLLDERTREEYKRYVSSIYSPFREIYSKVDKKKYRQKHGDYKYIEFLKEGRDYILDLLGDYSEFSLVREQIREEKLKELLDS